MKKWAVIVILLFIVNSCNQSDEKEIVSIGSPVYRDINNIEIKKLAMMYSAIQDKMNNVFQVMGEDDPETIDRIKKLCVESKIFRKETKNISRETVKKIFKEIPQQNISEELISRIQNRYSNDSEFKKVYDELVSLLSI